MTIPYNPLEETGGVDEQLYAFPSGLPHAGNTWASDMGMPLRDYFAAKALPIEMGRLVKQFEDETTGFDTWEDAQAYAAMMAYSMADRMMYARTRQTLYQDGND